MKDRSPAINVCIFLLLFIVLGAFFANVLAKPIYLTEEEIHHYTDIAKTAYYEGIAFIPKDDTIRITILNEPENSIAIFPNNPNKESLTVTFLGPSTLAFTNSPVTSFWGCFVFYGLLSAFVIYIIISFLKDRRKHRIL